MKVGENIDIMIFEIDKDNCKFLFGYKQLEENLWDIFENVFLVGFYYEGMIVCCDDWGVIVQMLYGLEVFVLIKYICKEDGQFVEVDEILMVKVIEFNCDDKCIFVFYMCYFDDICCEVKDEVCKEKQEECKQI